MTIAVIPPFPVFFLLLKLYLPLTARFALSKIKMNKLGKVCSIQN